MQSYGDVLRCVHKSTLLKYILNLLSHRSPYLLLVQTQVKEFTPSLQSPPPKQGEDSHSLILTRQLTPV